MKTLTHEDYTVGWICALPIEMAAAKAMLDEPHAKLSQSAQDPNTYSVGAIQGHNVVIACLPAGVYGTTSAAVVASHLSITFPAIRFGLMVGIGGGVPSKSADIRLGDVVISKPTGHYSGVVQYDYGKTVSGGVFEQTGSLNKPPSVLLTAIADLESNHLLGKSQIPQFLTKIVDDYPDLEQFVYPGVEDDQLFAAEYEHVPAETTCEDCDASRVVARKPRRSTNPRIHYGLIASGNQVIKHALTRDRLGKQFGILCFEMEAAGLMDNFPCLAVRGICDYSDTHKHKQWQAYAAATAAACAKDLLVVASVAHTKQTPTVQKILSQDESAFRLPFDMDSMPAVHHFVGRQGDLDALWTDLSPDQGQMRKVVALHGPSGMGKSQLALQFARLHKDDFTAVVWLDARSRQTVTRSLARVYVNLPDIKTLGEPQSQKEMENRAKQVLKWLETPENSKWLLIFDNVPHALGEGRVDDEGYDIRSFFPQVDRGSIIITARLLQAGELGRPRLVEKMAEGEALQLLTGESDAVLKVGKDGWRTKADLLRLLGQLDGRPLAIVLASAVMRSTGWSVSTYLHSYEQIQADLKVNSGTLPSCDRESLTAILVAFNRTRDTDPVAANVLRLLSYFGPDPVWFELLHSGASNPDMPDWFCRIVASKGALRPAIDRLEDLALIETDRTRETYSMHALIRHACRHVQKISTAEKDREFVAIALVSLGVATSQLPLGESHLQQRLLPHVNQMLQLVDHRPDDSYSPAVLKALNELGLFYWNQGKPSQAASMFHAAVAGYDHLDQPDKLNDPSFLLSLHRLGIAYQKQNRFHDAERAFQRALDGYRSLRGPTDISTVELSSCLASCYQSQNKLAEAERLFSQALQGYELTRGPHDRVTLVTLNQLGAVYHAANKPAAAETVFQRALRTAETLRGPNDSSALEATYNLGVLYRTQGRLPEAEKMLTRALHGFEKTLAPDHLSALRTAHALALVYKDQSKLAQARALGQRVVTGLSAVLGESDIQTANAKRDLGLIYRDEGKMTEAARLCHAAFTTLQSALGDGHPETLSALRDLGSVHGYSGNPMRAEEMCRRALEGFERSPLGADHVATLLAVYYLGVALQSQGKAEAETMLGRALAGFETRLGSEHVFTLNTVNQLGEWYWARRDLDAAARMYRRAATGFERTVGARHVWTLRAMNKLGFVYAQCGRPQEAETMYRQALTGFEGILGRDDAETQLVATRLRSLELDPETPSAQGSLAISTGTA
ncbi:hypothetical protein Aspvir_002814 [Aspergillus viridinutans]|uniref:AAA+ ATPase domain-containing protein n=1 Tax=Aspergillus viridinutans TaxID=75553 RepID=A0A9P3C3L1_ASPVI|nr:uncharacterized protein Aspvir_002814 [Aspergillus viridinutans]GIK07159.1 hypothetical protein Aspvir_002814 [Aspergillus viridinutans]